MGRLVASHYNVLVPLASGRTVAYNALSGALAVWEPAESQVFDRIAAAESAEDEPDVVMTLRYGGFVVDEEFDESAALRAEYERVRFNPKQMVFTVAPTLACNFGCDYCFQGPDKPSGRMSPAVQDQTVRFVEAKLDSIERLHVAWYGGEPLLAMGVIESLSERFIESTSQAGVRYDASIVTNGYRLDEATAQKLLGFRVNSAQVTLDGAIAEHDRRRTLLGGAGTFQRITANLAPVVRNTPLHVTVRINIDARNASGIEALLDDLVSQGFAGRKNFGVYFAPIEAITEGCHNVVNECLPKSDYGQLEARLIRYAFRRGLTGKPYPPRFRGVCGAVRPRGWVVLPNGDLHKCWDTVNSPDQRVGSVADPAALAGDRRALRWLQWSPFDNAVCRSCKLLPTCAGSCAHKFLNPTQTLGEAGSLPCPSWKFNIKEKLVLTAEATGAIETTEYLEDDVRTISTDLSVLSHSEATVG